MQTIEHMGSNTTIYDLRFLAHIILEAETPIVIGSGRKTMLTDSEILKDYNGLPYIPGTSIAGVIRHALPVDLGNKFFGIKDDKNNKGSEIIFSEAKLINDNGQVIDKLCNTDYNNFTKQFKDLPKRNHVRISHKGVAEDHCKFDEEVIYKGSRFGFDIEMVAKESEKGDASNAFDQVLTEIQKDTFRIGGGTRSGFGKMHSVSIKKRSFDLKKKEELSSYFATSSCLEKDYCSGWEDFDNSSEDHNWIKYSLTLTPQDFFSFGSGKGDNDVDTVPVKESYVKWDGNNGFFVENALLIPASSLKGALAHRVAYYYNLKHNIFAMQIPVEEFENYTGSNNPAVRMLFGCQKEGKSETVQKRGIAIFNDIFADYPGDKILNHVAIDRFTGGAMDGALYSEKVVDGKGELTFHTEVLIEKLPAIDNNDIDAQTIYKDAIEAFEKALGDIDKGLLPLGGGNGRGHGIFKCKFTSKD